MLNLSLVIITLNEEKNIKRCIESVPFAKEIIVVDSGSTDNTKQIAEKCGAKFIYNKWAGYGNQKQFAVEQANTEWILSLDADEWLSENLQKEVIDKVSFTLKQDNYKIFSFKRLSKFEGKFIRNGGWFPDIQARLFKKDVASWDKNEKIHEHLKTSETTKVLDAVMYHEPFNNLYEQVNRNMEYAKLIAEQKFKAGKRVKSELYIVIKTISKFIECYIIKKGFLDGLHGFIIAWNAAQSYLFQLYEIKRKIK